MTVNLFISKFDIGIPVKTLNDLHGALGSYLLPQLTAVKSAHVPLTSSNICGYWHSWR